MCLPLFMSLRIPISLRVYICVACDFCFFYICLASKKAKVMLKGLCFSKTIRVIHCFYPLKNPCKREESLLDIFSLESQTSFNCN